MPTMANRLRCGAAAWLNAESPNASPPADLMSVRLSIVIKNPLNVLDEEKCDAGSSS